MNLLSKSDPFATQLEADARPKDRWNTPSQIGRNSEPVPILLAKVWWIVLPASAIALATFLTAKFAMTTYYKASAVLRPVGEQTEMANLGASSALGVGLALDVGGFGAQAQKAEECLAILHSYEFANRLVSDHKLAATLNRESASHLFGHSSQDPKWRLYQLMEHRFSADYDRLAGNLTLNFLAPSRREAQAILGNYIDDLRERLRSAEIQDAGAAISSLEMEAESTPDSLLRTQVYEVVARQIQREKLAQAKADFAFTVVQPPIAPDTPDRPRALFDAVIAGVLVAFAIFVAIAVYNSTVAIVADR